MSTSTLIKRTTGVATAGALMLSSIAPAASAPFVSGAAAMKSAASPQVTDVRWRGRWGGAFAAGIIGVILALPVNGLSTKFNGGAVSAPTLAFNFHVTPVIAIQALVFAIVIGALGGWLPARQAMRVSVVNALRRN